MSQVLSNFYIPRPNEQLELAFKSLRPINTVCFSTLLFFLVYLNPLFLHLALHLDAK